MRHSRKLADSGIYHVMLRGVNRDVIFLEDEDYERFLRAVSQARDASGCTVLAYCLMPNHVHLALRTHGEPIGTVVKRVGVRYAGWFNTKYGRVGHLFQDRFRSVPVETDAQLAVLLRYIWNNPVKAGLVEHADEYRWSSRRFLGRQGGLVRDEELRALVDWDRPEFLRDDALALPDGEAVARHRPPPSVEEAARLLEAACGASSPAEFVALSAAHQRLAVRMLRTRSTSYRVLAVVTGLSRSAVHRLHVAGSADALAAWNQGRQSA